MPQGFFDSRGLGRLYLRDVQEDFLKDLMARALDLATLKGADYADVRVTQTTEQLLTMKNGLVETLEFNESIGFGVRVLAAGRWGFCLVERPDP